MLAQYESALGIEQQAIAAGLAAAWSIAGVAAGVQEFLQAAGFAPLINFVGRNIREEQVAAVLHPHGALCPVEAISQPLDGGVRRDELVQRVVVPLHLADGGMHAAIKGGRLRGIGF